MKKLAALVCLSAGLFGLFPDDAQAQRATWSGFGRNSSYEFEINLNVKDTDDDPNKGFYSQAVKNFSLTRNPDPDVIQTNITSSGFGNLAVSRNKDTTNNLEIIDIKILFGNESPIETVLLSINYDLSLTDSDDFNVNVNNLLDFFNDFSQINNPEQSLFQFNQIASEVRFKDSSGDQIVTLQSVDKFVKLPDTPIKVAEPRFIYSFVILFSVSATGILKQKKLYSYVKSTSINS